MNKMFKKANLNNKQNKRKIYINFFVHYKNF